MNNIVRIEDAVRLYKRGSEEVHAIDGVTMDIARGEYLTVVGRSGSGKTTLLNLIGCIDKPTTGRVNVHGVETENLSDRALATLRSTTMGFVFQQFFLIPTLTAVENVMVPGRFSAKRDPNLEEKARRLLDMVELSDRADHLPKELSGGEMQRVALARALVNEPAVLLADEPTGNLDSISAGQIADIFERLNSEGLTIVVVTHSEELSAKATRQINLRDGKIVDDVRTRAVPSVEPAPGKAGSVLESVPIPGYMPATLEKRKFGSPVLSALLLVMGAVMISSAFMPFVEKFTGLRLLDRGLFVVSLYSGGNLTRTFAGKPAYLLTGIWPILIGVMLGAAGIAFLMNKKRLASISVIISGVLAVTLAVVSISTIGSRLGPDIATGYGYWVFLGSGVAALATGILIAAFPWLRRKYRRKES